MDQTIKGKEYRQLGAGVWSIMKNYLTKMCIVWVEWMACCILIL